MRKRKQVNQMKAYEMTDSSSDDGYILFSLVCDVPIHFMGDSGADVNVLDKVTYDKISHLEPLKHTTMKIYTYGTEEELPLNGHITTTINEQRKSSVAIFYIASAGNRPLLSYDAAKEHGVIKITLSAISKKPSSCMTSSQIHEEDANRFTGVGKLKNCQASTPH